MKIRIEHDFGWDDLKSVLSKSCHAWRMDTLGTGREFFEWLCEDDRRGEWFLFWVMDNAITEDKDGEPIWMEDITGFLTSNQEVIKEYVENHMRVEL